MPDPDRPSSAIRALEYDPGTRRLTVEFQSGVTYQYVDVPEETYREFAGAESKGRFFQQRVRPRFAYLRPPEPEGDEGDEADPAPATSHHTWRVDVVEDTSAAIEVDGRQITPVPLWLLPAGVRQGDVLAVTHDRGVTRSVVRIERT